MTGELCDICGVRPREHDRRVCSRCKHRNSKRSHHKKKATAPEIGTVDRPGHNDCATDYFVTGPAWGNPSRLPTREVKIMLAALYFEPEDRLRRNGKTYRAEYGKLVEL
jgi:hypothetical protein